MLHTVRRFAPITLLSCLLVAPGSASPGTATWLRIGLAGAKCARGDPYAFWFHRGSSRRLLLYFQDGGGCWSYETCRRGSSFFQDSLRSPTDPSLPEGGILDFSDARNPFRDYTAAYLPSCTGDVHWGNNVAHYTAADGRTLAIHHFGFANARRALRWVYRRYRSPRRVFVTGCSAGSVGSVVFAPYVMRHYRRASIVQLGDSLAFVFHRPVDIETGWRADRNLPRWIPRMRSLDPERMTMAQYYSIVAGFYRGRSFGQFNYARDAVQTRYYVAVGGKGEDFPAALRSSLEAIHRRAANFRSYVAPGDSHCVLPLPSFYRARVDGVSLRAWVQRYASGRPVRSIGKAAGS